MIAEWEVSNLLFFLYPPLLITVWYTIQLLADHIVDFQKALPM
jgi:hypothetical protein